MTQVEKMPARPPTAKFPKVVAKEDLAGAFLGAAGAGVGIVSY